jgi:glyoxylase-like metal-dependent hydrolase (beta-lactamase superfamily II)
MIRIVFLASLVMFSVLAQASVDFPMKAEKVAENVYAILTPSRKFPNPQNKGWNSNSAFIVTNSGVLLFDTGSGTKIGEALKQTIASVTDKPVRWIVNSHGHGDHWLGNAAFSKTVEKIYASKEVTNHIKTEGRTWVERFNHMTEGATGQSDIVEPNVMVSQRIEQELGDTRFILFPSGNSHSKGDILVWMPENKVLLSGDVMYIDRMPSTFASDLAQWIKLLGELEKMNPKVVVPGHGKVGDTKDITQLRGLFTTFWNAVEAGMDDGKADFEMLPDVKKALSSYRKSYPGMDEKLKRDISHVFLQVEAAAFK